MKSLTDYIRECGEGCATPSTTLGMGNPMMPTDTQPGSEPFAYKRPVKHKKAKKQLHEGQNPIRIDDYVEEIADPDDVKQFLKEFGNKLADYNYFLTCFKNNVLMINNEDTRETLAEVNLQKMTQYNGVKTEDGINPAEARLVKKFVDEVNELCGEYYFDFYCNEDNLLHVCMEGTRATGLLAEIDCPVSGYTFLKFLK